MPIDFARQNLRQPRATAIALRKVGWRRPRRGEWLLVGLIFVSAVAAGIAYAVRHDNDTTPWRGDAVHYHGIAVNLAQGKGFAYFDPPQPTAIRPPAYPLFLAVVYKLFGVNLLAARLAQAVLRGVTCVLIYFTGRVLFRPKVAALAAGISVVYPFFLYHHVGFLLGEGLYTFLLVLLVLLLLRAADVKRKPLLFGAGLVLGALFLTSPRIFLFPLFIPLWLGLVLGDWRKAAAGSGLVALGCLAVLLPWTLRNYFLFDRVVLITTHGGRDLLAGVNPGYREWRESDTLSRVLQEHSRVVESTPSLNPGADGGIRMGSREDVTDTEGYHLALRVLFSRPGEVLKNVPYKLAEFWKFLPARGGPYDGWFHRVAWILSMDLLTILGLIGFVLAHDRWRHTAVFVAVVLSAMLVHMVFTSQHRYQTAVMPFLIIMAAYVLERCGSGLRQHLARRSEWLA